MRQYYKIFFPYFLVSVLTLSMGSASGAIVTSISTGATADGTVLASGALDSRYQLIAAPATFLMPQNMYVAAPVDFEGFVLFSAWVANTASSKWIAPYNDGVITYPTASPPASYTYRTSFDLSGFDPSTASIQGSFAADEGGTDILLNGVSLSISTSGAGYNHFTPLNISSGFIAGVNTLDFVTSQINLPVSNPVGLQVQANVTATAPEPASVSLLAIGMVGLLTRQRR